MKTKHVCILGAGITGLSAAYAFSNKGFKVTVLEKNEEIGGLCSSYISNSGIVFDYGPHGIVEKTFPEIGDFCSKILDNKINRFFHRNIKINFDQITYNYPPNFIEILKKEKLISNIEYFFSFIYSKMFPNNNYISFKDVTIDRFGKKLSKRFFEEFTEKTWGYPTTDLDAKFALERIPEFKIMKMFKNIFNKTENKNYSFAYPLKGIYKLAEALEKEVIKDNSNNVITSVEIKKISVENKNVKQVYYNDKIIECDYLVSTIPLDSFIKLLPIEEKVLESANNLCYKSVIFAFVEIKKKNILKNHWVYFQSKKIIFNRIYEPKFFSRETTPSDISGLCLEITISDQTKDLEKLKERISIELENYLNINKNEIISIEFKTKTHCYPIYKIGYDKNLKIINGFIDKFENLISVGRQGLFRYIDMDYSIKSGFMSVNLIKENITTKEFDKLIQKDGK